MERELSNDNSAAASGAAVTTAQNSADAAAVTAVQAKCFYLKLSGLGFYTSECAVRMAVRFVSQYLLAMLYTVMRNEECAWHHLFMIHDALVILRSRCTTSVIAKLICKYTHQIAW